MLRLIGPLLLAAGLALPVQAATTPADDVTRFALDNGMEVVVIEDHRAPVAVHMVWYRAGAADERPGVSGVAHFLEHLMFKATDDLDSGEFSATVARHGGSDNAFTSQDYTAYFQRVAADRLGRMMQMEADRMVDLRLTETDIKTERNVIIEERNQRVENNPGALLREQQRAAQYLNHPYGTPIIGWQAEMSELGMEATMDHYRTYYAPNNAVLVVAGDVTTQQVRTLAEKHYGPLPANPDLPERARPQEPRQLAERRLVLEDPRVSQPYVSRSYLAPERDSGAQERAAALTLLAEILGGGQTSMLNRELQFENKTAVYTSAWYRGMSLDDTTFNLTVVPAAGVTLEQAETAMDRVLEELLATGIDDDQLARIKTQIRASRIYERDDVTARARRYGRALTQGLTVDDVHAWPEILQDVTEKDILNAARDVLDRKRAVTAHLKTPEVTQ
ncbi:M16 family metallopeptidase [Roseovarius salinarum]|uniref:M16 family metallopeptidase n=1 Tax=Roseovarius salinarum TaxID=1981892 RepID=UPI000C34C4DD|nr:pitrilysin family protein [Roseovarius salinarum]